MMLKMVDFENVDMSTAEVSPVLPVYISEHLVGFTWGMWEPDGLYVRMPHSFVGEYGKALNLACQVGAAEFIPRGMGRVDENDYVWNYRLISIYASIRKK